MRYETLKGDVIFYSPQLGIAQFYNRNDYEYLNRGKEKYFIDHQGLAEIYPGAGPCLRQKIKDHKAVIREIGTEYDISKEVSSYDLPYKKEEEVLEAKLAHRANQIDKHQRKIKELESILFFMNTKEIPQSYLDFEAKKKIAKAFPITSLLSFNSAGFARCPFHNERNNSLKYYPKSNSWHCFGCQEGGDAIEMISKLKDLDFVEAVNYLSK